jgi:hypothetical protein
MDAFPDGTPLPKEWMIRRPVIETRVRILAARERWQGLLADTWCINPREGLSPGQKEAIDRVYAAYPELNDDAFVAAGRDEWLADR